MTQSGEKRQPRLMKLSEVSDTYGVHPNSLRKWDANGQLKAIRIGTRRDRRYLRKDVEKYFKKRNG